MCVQQKVVTYFRLSYTILPSTHPLIPIALYYGMTTQVHLELRNQLPDSREFFILKIKLIRKGRVLHFFKQNGCFPCFAASLSFFLCSERIFLSVCFVEADFSCLSQHGVHRSHHISHQYKLIISTSSTFRSSTFRVRTTTSISQIHSAIQLCIYCVMALTTQVIRFFSSSTEFESFVFFINFFNSCQHKKQLLQGKSALTNYFRMKSLICYLHNIPLFRLEVHARTENYIFS